MCLIFLALASSYQRIHAARPVNINSLAFLVTGNVSASISNAWILLICIFNPNLMCSSTVLLLFMILNSHQMSPNFLVCTH